MARFMDAGNVRLVFDLIWVKLPDGSKGTVAENASGAKLAVHLKGDEYSHIAGYLNDPEGGRKRRIAFAAVVASAFRSEKGLLLFLEMEDDEAIMVAVRNGLPVPDYDRYGYRQDLMSAAREFLQDHPSAQILSNTDDFPQSEIFDLNAFLDDKETRKLFSKAALRPISNNRKTMVLFAALIAFGGYVGWDHYQTKKKADMAAQVAAQQQKINPEQLYAQLLPSAIATEGMQARDAAALLKNISSWEMSAGGWGVNYIKCNAGGCGMTYGRRLKTSTFRDLVGAVGKGNLTLATDQTAIKSVPYPAPLAKIGRTALKPAQDALVDMLSPLQRLGGAVTFGVSPMAKFPAGGVTPPGAISKGEVTVQGPFWASEIMSGLPEWALVREFGITSKGADLFFNATIIFFSK